MGISLRIFLIEDDDSIKRLALAKYERLLEGNPKERLPQYADKRVRYALAMVDLKDRQPLEILRIQYSYIYFDSEGRIDATDLEEETRLAYEALSSWPIERLRGPVIDARQKFAKKRFNHKYKWTPTPEIEARIVKEIFGKR